MLIDSTVDGAIGMSSVYYLLWAENVRGRLTRILG
jgi:hypothetical protein